MTKYLVMGTNMDIHDPALFCEWTMYWDDFADLEIVENNPKSLS